jgi:hypothetical protein
VDSHFTQKLEGFLHLSSFGFASASDIASSKRSFVASEALVLSSVLARPVQTIGWTILVSSDSWDLQHYNVQDSNTALHSHFKRKLDGLFPLVIVFLLGWFLVIAASESQAPRDLFVMSEAFLPNPEVIPCYLL